LKPLGLKEEAAWVAETLHRLPENGFRVERPIRTINGEWFADGWCAWRRLEGHHETRQRWDQVLQVTESFHRALQHLQRPAFLDIRRTPWDVGDLAAWEGVFDPLPAPIGSLVDDLLGRLHTVDLPSQVIHGDMSRNMLFSVGLLPAVIDFSPYFRPAGFASAVVVVDALTWYGAGPSILREVEHIPQIDQLLFRAAIYRLLTTATVYSDNSGRLQEEVEANQPTLELLRSFAH
jgi:uncharacterized protein (TIGR02569 family)